MERISFREFSDRLNASRNVVANRAAHWWGDNRPVDVVLQCGTGMEHLLDRICIDGSDSSKWLKFSEVLHFPYIENGMHNPTKDVPHVRFGEVGDVRDGGLRVAILTRRLHTYDGFSPHAVVHPLRTMLHWGARYVILTSSCGALRTDSELKLGDLVVVRDNVSLLLGMSNPLWGLESTALHPTTVSVAQPYSRPMRDLVIEVYAGLSDDQKQLMPLRDGKTFVGVTGPTFESGSDRAILRGHGDIVGPSLVNEAIAARHIGCRNVLALAHVGGKSGEQLTREQVMHASTRAAPVMADLVFSTIALLPLLEKTKN